MTPGCKHSSWTADDERVTFETCRVLPSNKEHKKLHLVGIYMIMVIDCSPARKERKCIHKLISVFKGLVTYHIPVSELDQIRVSRVRLCGQHNSIYVQCTAWRRDYWSLVPRMSSSHKPFHSALCRSAARVNFRSRHASHVLNPTA